MIRRSTQSEQGCWGRWGPKQDSEAVRAKRERDKINENAGSAGSAQSSEGEGGRRLYSCAKRREAATPDGAKLGGAKANKATQPATILQSNASFKENGKPKLECFNVA